MENVNVVIVDDNPMILNTLDEVISSEAGLSVIGRADNGKDAIDMIKDTQPDVVLLDLVMPQMDGITVVENIKKKTSMLKNPAFIILSAVGGEQMTEEAFQAGANYFLMKPFDKDILVNKPGFVKAMWCGCQECEDKIKEVTGATSRCMPFEQETLSDKCVCCGKPAKKMVYWGKAY